MLRITCVSTAVLLIAFMTSAGASPLTSPDDVLDAQLDAELLSREVDRQLAKIRSEDELEAYLANPPEDSPLHHLSKGALTRFVKSLVFNGGGLSSFNYVDLSAELTATEAYSILTLFGAQRSIGAVPTLRVVTAADAAIVAYGARPALKTDYRDFRCAPPATCSQSISDICIGSNC